MIITVQAVGEENRMPLSKTSELASYFIHQSPISPSSVSNAVWIAGASLQTDLGDMMRNKRDRDKFPSNGYKGPLCREIKSLENPIFTSKVRKHINPPIQGSRNCK